MTSESIHDDAPALACDMTAIPSAERDRHASVVRSLFAAVAEVRDLPDGHAFRLPAEFISRERLCCPFFTFTIAVEPARGPIWLQITGPAGAKAIFAAELGDLIPALP